jgi:hypothetical protein
MQGFGSEILRRVGDVRLVLEAQCHKHTGSPQHRRMVNMCTSCMSYQHSYVNNYT